MHKDRLSVFFEGPAKENVEQLGKCAVVRFELCASRENSFYGHDCPQNKVTRKVVRSEESPLLKKKRKKGKRSSLAHPHILGNFCDW